MSKRLKTRTKIVQKLPYGKYTWEVHMEKGKYGPFTNAGNIESLKPVFELLDTTGQGQWKECSTRNYKGRRVCTKILLSNGMDVALLKMCYADKFTKIFKLALASDKNQPRE